MTALQERARKVVLSTVSSDSHTWNLVFLQLLLEEHGFEVVNLGPCVPDEVLLDAVREHAPDLVVISTVNGHGHLDGARVVRRLRADPLTCSVPAVIGGKLGIRGAGDRDKVHALIEAGFDAVYTDSADADELPAQLELLAATGTAGRRTPERVA
ncbi:cobalamin-dependent protein [Microbispora sp. RL4-1S]|uniref:Cobalamin-dependent protein n=1 Tax=Microbispora oryzae TaxID=2806554 RepID=A0A941AGR6_9ACTN|nr:cobalamin-dependent protein [Microbispora oryzae]MBP2703225.1 cobalamin-dependent protein [Microbispora oryzae]